MDHQISLPFNVIETYIYIPFLQAIFFFLLFLFCRLLLMVICYFFCRHIICSYLICNLFIFTYYISMNICFNCIRNYIGTGVQSNNGMFAYIKFNSKKYSLEFIINHSCHFREGFPLKLERKASTINLMTHSLRIFFQPFSVHFILLVTGTCDEVSEK